jgi:hypothetical protein
MCQSDCFHALYTAMCAGQFTSEGSTPYQPEQLGTLVLVDPYLAQRFAEIIVNDLASGLR